MDKVPHQVFEAHDAALRGLGEIPAELFGSKANVWPVQCKIVAPGGQSSVLCCGFISKRGAA